MKKIKTLVMLSISALLLNSCVDNPNSNPSVDSSIPNTEKISTSKNNSSLSVSTEEMTLEKIWKNAFDKDKFTNYTADLTWQGDGYVSHFRQKLTADDEGNCSCSILVTKEEDGVVTGSFPEVIYKRSKDYIIRYDDLEDGSWEKKTAVLKDFDDYLIQIMNFQMSYLFLCPNFGNFFDKFILADDGPFVFTGTEDVDVISTNSFIDGWGNVDYYKATVTLENDHLKEVTFCGERTNDRYYSTKFSDCGTTSIQIPTNIHKHTFSDEWSYNEDGHWHKATCVHNLSEDYQQHSFVDGECTVCHYKKIS